MPSDTIVQFDFSEALKHLRQGKRVRRASWGELSRSIKMYQDFPYIRVSIGGTKRAWPANHNDILATDWVLVEDEPYTVSKLGV